MGAEKECWPFRQCSSLQLALVALRKGVLRPLLMARRSNYKPHEVRDCFCFGYYRLSRSNWCLTQRRLFINICWMNKRMRRWEAAELKEHQQREGTPQLAKEGRLALSVPTQAALAERRKESSSPVGAAPSSSAVLSWKAPLTTSHLAIFQRLMNSVLSGLIYCTRGVYLDDVIINSLSCELHLKDLNEVLVRRKETGISVKCKKCQFWEKTVNFLGH